MYKKAIVMEIKAAYAIAMEEGGGIIRIKKKDGLSVGDSIYVLPEDLYHQEHMCDASSSSGSKKTLLFLPAVQKSALIKIASIAAMLILCIMLASPRLSVTTYAQASFDGTGSIQLSLDRNFQIIKAVSPDQSVPDSILHALRGKRLDEAGEELRSACGLDGVLVGYALTDEEADSSALASRLESLFPSRSVTFVNGTNQDIENAEKESLSLGKYLTSQQDETDSDKPEQEIEQENEESFSAEKEDSEEENDSEASEQTEQKQDSETEEPAEQKQDSETEEPAEQKQDSEASEQTEQKQDSEAEEPAEQKQDSEAEEPAEQKQDSEAEEPAEQKQDSEAEEPAEQKQDSEAEEPEASDQDFEQSEEEKDSSSEEEDSSSEEEIEED